jgi:hypothetical protein
VGQSYRSGLRKNSQGYMRHILDIATSNFSRDTDYPDCSFLVYLSPSKQMLRLCVITASFLMIPSSLFIALPFDAMRCIGSGNKVNINTILEALGAKLGCVATILTNFYCFSPVSPCEFHKALYKANLLLLNVFFIHLHLVPRSTMVEL